MSIAPVLAGLVASGEQPALKAQEPRYDTAAVVDLSIVVTDVRLVPPGSPLPGVHLSATPDRARIESEAIDIYLAPLDYLKDFDIRFAKGDLLQVVGSKVKFAGSAVLLAREVTKSGTTVYLRDNKGEPNWGAQGKRGTP